MGKRESVNHQMVGAGEIITQALQVQSRELLRNPGKGAHSGQEGFCPRQDIALPEQHLPPQSILEVLRLCFNRHVHLPGSNRKIYPRSYPRSRELLFSLSVRRNLILFPMASKLRNADLDSAFC